MIKKFTKEARSYKGIVNSAVTITVTNLNHILFSNRSWTESLFKRMKFVKQAGMTGKIEKTGITRKETKLNSLHQIINM